MSLATDQSSQRRVSIESQDAESSSSTVQTSSIPDSNSAKSSATTASLTAEDDVPPSAVRYGPGAVKYEGRLHALVSEEAKLLQFESCPRERPHVHGVPSETLWMLLRRFSKQIQHVKVTNERPPGGLDLNIASYEEYTAPDKLRMTVERLYMTVIIGMLGAVKHIARIRSWNETVRTSLFCLAYTIAWIYDCVFSLFLWVSIILIVVPKSRRILFPPAPISLVNARTGTAQKPPSGGVGSTDSASGGSENMKGEAVEIEAHDFVSSMAAVAVRSALGRQNNTNSEDNEGASKSLNPAEKTMDPVALAAKSMNEEPTYVHGNQSPTAKTEINKPMEDAVWAALRPIMHIVSNISDGWERVGNALSPVRPFDTWPRNRFGLFLAGFGCSCLFITPYMVTKVSSFVFGFAMFGDPIIQRMLAYMNETFTHWLEAIEPRNTVFYGVPTNAQLSLVLLREAEKRRRVLPAYLEMDERAEKSAGEKDATIAEEGKNLAGSDEEVVNAVNNENAPESVAAETLKPAQGSKRRKFLSVARKAAKFSVSTMIAVDQVRAKVGRSETSRARLGALSGESDASLRTPVKSSARFNGKRGYFFVFAPEGRTHERDVCCGFVSEMLWRNSRETDVEFAFSISDIVELRKVGGLGWKTEMIAGWALQRSVKDGLSITLDYDGVKREYVINAVEDRDVIFNRLLSMGPQTWEAW
ncbi:hypothetical protein BZA70DRAFT_279078 [Myxozyma melibiosi]|uniref:GRAM domain-containing protein n=1 Tax=Myxozyma melibiosi TaxID=54550 RepID=A0ABR1F5M0_9ASCO